MNFRKLLFFILFSTQLVAQTSGFEIPNYAPKSPEAAAFLTYGEYPVDLSTGVPNISLPLYTIETKGLNIPISLSYHAGGIKVSQEASWVGLGWNLNFGGQIILRVVDDVDEGNAMIDQIPSEASLDYYDTNPYDFTQGPQVPEQWDKSRVKDIYMVSTPTVNGQFYIRNRATNDIVVYPPQAFKVESISQSDGMPGYTGFKVIDPAGNAYFFGIKEQSYQPNTGNGTQVNFTSAWYINEIRTAANDRIVYNYEDDGTLVDISKSQRINIIFNQLRCGCSNPATSNSIGSISTQSSTTNTFPKKIKEIIFNNGNSKVLFEREGGRQDLVNGNSLLRSVKVMQKNPLSNQFELVKGHSFVYSYFNSSQTGNNSYKRKRLRLDAIETLLEGDQHSFVYSDIVMPAKDSYSQDAFGYFNNENNSDLIPKTVITTPYSVTVGNADRSVNSSVNQVGVLKEIHYPTKGWTLFNFETNTHWGQNTYSYVKNVSLSVQGTGAGNNNPTPFNTEDCMGPNCVVYASLPLAANGSKSISATLTITNNVQDDDTEIKYQYVRFWVHMNGQRYDSGKKNDNQTLTQNFTIPGGQGYVTAEAWGEHVRGILSFSFNETDSNPGNRPAAGLRIASIENYDHTGILVLKKTYDYSLPHDPNKSSGKWINNPYTGYWTRSFRNVSNFQPCTGGTMSTQSVDVATIQTLSSNSVGLSQNSIAYEYVKERSVSATDSSLNGYTLYKFLLDTDLILDPSIHIPRTWKIGKLKEKTFYKDGLSTFLRRETNTYAEDQSKASRMIGFKLVRRTNMGGINQSNIAFFSGCVPGSFAQANSIFKYDIPFYWEYLKSTVIEENFFNGSELTGTVVTNKTYNYNNPDHLQLSSEVTASSEGEVLETRYFYPHDALVSTEPAVTDLIAKNIISIPLVTEKFKGGDKLQQQKTAYKNWGNNLLLPELLQVAKGDDIPETRVRFTKVDNATGNVQEFQMENGMKVSYIYGYNNTLVVAKIENKEYNTISTSLITPIQNATNTGNETALRNALTNLRSNSTMASAMVTTYTYKPLIGVTSITDPKGDTVFYEYDSEGRLEYVRDKDNNLLSSYKYHYKY